MSSCRGGYWTSEMRHATMGRHSARAPRRARVLLPFPRSGGRSAVSTVQAMRIADAFAAATVGPGLTDHDFVLRCSCGTEQRLDEMTLESCGPITLYDCVR